MSSFGENLRRERELRGVSLRDMAEATKISTRFLAAIEEDRLEILPGGMFPRSFVRQYARHLGLDADRVVAEFVFQHPPVTVSEVPRSKGGDWSLRTAGIVLIAASGIAGLWFARPTPPEPRVAAPERPAQPLTEHAAGVPSEPVAEASVPEASEPTAPPASRSPPATLDAPSVASSLPAVPEGTLVITLTARMDCWIGVEIDGEMVINRVLPEGESRTLRAREQISLSVGNAGGLSFELNGRPGVSLGSSGAVRHDIVINRENMDSFIAANPASETR